MTNKNLIDLAITARKNSYAPYSRFLVGAALLCENGQVFCGANAENASYSLTCCAERSALFSAVSAGNRKFSKIAVVGGGGEDLSELCYPCGACLQALSEFSPNGDLKIILWDGKKEAELSLAELLPRAFNKK